MQVWLYNQDLLVGANGKDLPPEWAVHRFWAISKCQFGNTVGEAVQIFFSAWCLVRISLQLSKCILGGFGNQSTTTIQT